MYVCMYKRYDLIKFLCENDVYITDNVIIISASNIKILNILVNYGKLDTNRIIYEKSILKIAIYNGDAEFIRLIFNYGLVLEKCNQEDLIYALTRDYIRGSPNISKVILKCGWILSPTYDYINTFMENICYNPLRIGEYLQLLP